MDEIRPLYRDWQKARGKRKTKLKETLLRRIWEHYHPRLQTFLASIPREIREDRVSEILLTVFESLETYNPDYAFSTWLYRVARNSEVDRFRRKKPQLVEWEEEIHTPEEKWETPEDIVLRKVEREELVQAMETLNPPDRELLFLTCYEEMTYKEAGRILGRPEGTVKYEMYRIKKALRKELTREVCDERA
ncbi:MAG: sigma-70 family RNA polymerase sigma factor [Spirochaetales bacterium]|nr:sigma-70 family RNA polymerase sigma factor [Spirochaetales bacterium]